MDREKNEDKEQKKEFNIMMRILLYLRRILISLIINIIIAGIFVIIFQLVYKTGINKECFANAMLGIGIVYLINCVTFFRKDIYQYQGDMNRAFFNPRISEKRIAGIGLSNFSNTETFVLATICSALTIGIAYFVVIF